MNSFGTVLSRLQNVQQRSNSFTGCCPAHDDREASLSVDTGEDGKVLLKCFAGCTFEEIVKALDLKPADLMGGGNNTPSSNTATAQLPGCTLAEYSELKKIPVSFLHEVGCSDVAYMNARAVRISYRDLTGQEISVQFRVALRKGEHGDNRFRWKKGDKAYLYGLWRLTPSPEFIVLAEGPSDCHTLWFHNIPALGIPSASTFKEEWSDYLDRILVVYVVIEPDKGGETVKKWIAKSKIRDRVRLVSFGDHKDPSGLYLDNPEEFTARFQKYLDAAIPWTEQESQEAEAKKNEAWELCRDLAIQSKILDCFADDLKRSGVVGVRKLAKLLFLILVTRGLKRPVSAAVKGPSSGGKSYLVESVLSYFPGSTYYALSAMSERALAYSDEPLQHRFLVLYEANGMQGEMASYLIRSLLSEGCIRYETVEKTKDGIQAKLIEREGPTGLLVTTTAVSLHPENETRLISMTVTDTPEQTHDIFTALAEEGGVEIDKARWHALQEWIDQSEHRVVIPYAKILAELIPPLAVRLRRDFGALLNLIRGHAILHQKNRGRDQSSIIATIEDYGIVRDLVADLVAEGIEATVPATVRKTVDTVKKLIEAGTSEVSVARLAQELKLDKASASRRTRSALDRGFLKNLESKQGRPFRLVVGDPLPEEKQILPTADEVLHCCTVNGEGKDLPPSSALDNQEGEEQVSPSKDNCNTATPPNSDGEPLHRCSVNEEGIHPSPSSPHGKPLNDTEVF